MLGGAGPAPTKVVSDAPARAAVYAALLSLVGAGEDPERLADLPVHNLGRPTVPFSADAHELAWCVTRYRHRRQGAHDHRPLRLAVAKQAKGQVMAAQADQIFGRELGRELRSHGLGIVGRE